MPEPIDVAKAELRAAMRAVRRAIADDPGDRAARSGRIGGRVLAELGRRHARRVLLFESLPGEPDTAGWIDELAARGIETFLPVVDGDDLRIRPDTVEVASLDAVVVPGLAFTATGQRLGQGGGHYDRFLPRLGDGCLTLGVCFAEQLVEALPTAAHDRTVDVVVTDAVEAPSGVDQAARRPPR